MLRIHRVSGEKGIMYKSTSTYTAIYSKAFEKQNKLCCTKQYSSWSYVLLKSSIPNFF